MKYQFGLFWWSEKIIAKRYLFNVSDHTSTSPDVPDDVMRSYIDTVLCLNLLSEYKLLSPEMHRESAIFCVKNIRHNISRYDDPDYDIIRAQDTIRPMVILSKILELRC